jgi:hypothetical protein
MVERTASRLAKGKAPGSPRHTGQIWVLGFLAKCSLEQAQNIFDFVESSI